MPRKIRDAKIQNSRRLRQERLVREWESEGVRCSTTVEEHKEWIESELLTKALIQFARKEPLIEAITIEEDEEP